jgi:hypothetical protein
MSPETAQGLRKIVARRDGYTCYLCGCPTGATLEHVLAAKRDARGTPTQGKSNLANLRLACPYCNLVKGDRPVEEFIALERWRIEPPADLPVATRDMLAECFGWRKREGTVYTGSAHARLEFKHGQVAVLVRAGDRDDWQRIFLGPQTHPRVTLAAWDFLRRHNTPPRPRRRIPQSKMSRMTGRGAIPLVPAQIVSEIKSS